MTLRGRIAVTVVFFVVTACATSPTGRSQLVLLPESQMTTMGVQAFHQIQQETPAAKDEAITRYVQCVADAITGLPSVREQSRDWEVEVFDKEDVNAFALPGGKIGVYKGLLKAARTPDQLAAVIGHEVGHVLARHGNERVSQQFAAQQALGLIEGWLTKGNVENRNVAMAALGVGAQVGVLLPFSRVQENEADTIGLELMARAGFDPRASVTLWQNMAEAGDGGPPEFLSTHPSHDTRVERLRSGMDVALGLYRQAQAAGQNARCLAPKNAS